MMDTLKEEMKTSLMQRNNAMVKDPHKSKEGNPRKNDMLCT